MGKTPPLDPAVWAPAGSPEPFVSYTCNQCGKRMKRWTYEDPTGQIEGFVQHRKRCTGRVGVKSAAGDKVRMKDEEIVQRVNPGQDDEPEEVEVEEDEKAEMQFLLDFVTEALAPKD